MMHGYDILACVRVVKNNGKIAHVRVFNLQIAVLARAR